MSSSLAFSVAFCTPRKQNNTSISSSSSCAIPKNQNIDKPEIRIPAQTHLKKSTPQSPTAPLLQANEEAKKKKKKKKKNLMGRREAIAAAGIIGALLQSQLPLTAASEESTCEFTVSPSGLAFCDKFVGLGPQPAPGQLIKAHYVGKLENGKIFDSSYNRGKPLTFRVGVGEVIKGWDQGILGTEGVPPMLAGGKRTLRIPPELGYGMRGAGCRGGTCIIPPDSVLFFDVEFMGKA